MVRQAEWAHERAISSLRSECECALTRLNTCQDTSAMREEVRLSREDRFDFRVCICVCVNIVPRVSMDVYVCTYTAGSVTPSQKGSQQQIIRSVCVAGLLSHEQRFDGWRVRIRRAGRHCQPFSLII
jgi:hypothetical protein